jgi:hypothetical protein
MKYHLVVLQQFQSFLRGDIIKDAALLAKILAGPEASFVVRISAGKD